MVVGAGGLHIAADVADRAARWDAGCAAALGPLPSARTAPLQCNILISRLFFLFAGHFVHYEYNLKSLLDRFLRPCSTSGGPICADGSFFWGRYFADFQQIVAVIW